MIVSLFCLRLATSLSLWRAIESLCALRECQPPINLAHRIDVAFAVFDDLRQLPGAVVGVDLRAVEIFFWRGDAQRFRQRVEAHVFAAPFAPFLHGVEDRRVAKTGEGDFSRWFDLVDNP